ncbi:MAG: N-acetyltransferase family protein [Actinomycetota bacterium]
MPNLDLEPFGPSHVAGAAALLGARHARHRAAEALLPDSDPAAALEETLGRADMSGVMALREGLPVAFIVAQVSDHSAFGRHAWIAHAGHAATEPEALRDCYAAAADAWVGAGATRHYVLVPTLPADLDPWYRLGFHHMHVEAIRETGADEVPFPPGIQLRRGGIDDLDTAMRLDRLISDTQGATPSFGWVPEDEEARRADWIETLEDPSCAYWVAERAGRPVAHATLYDAFPGFATPEGAIYLASTAVVAEERGSGIGTALTSHVLRWARDQGAATMVTNWRMTNLEASRFWPARGFRPTYHRLHRLVVVG